MDENRAERGCRMRRNSVGLAIALWMLGGCSSSRTSPAPAVKEVSSEPDSPVSSPSPVASRPVKTLVVKKRSAESLRDRIRTTVERMQADAESRQHRRSLSRVVKALLELEQQVLVSSREGDAATGLSWRVHLLPFLGEAVLYREFHLDEPWDSPHNMTLVSRMPQVYGEDALGLTRLHRPSQQSPTNNLLLFDVSEDAADFWTKPNGLTDDAATIPVRIALRNGALYEVESNVTATEWQAWRQSSQGHDEVPAWLKRMALPLNVQAVVNDSVSTADRSVHEPWPIPTDAWCAITLEPRRLLSHPLRAELFHALTSEMNESQSPNRLQAGLGSYGPQLHNALRWLNKHNLALQRTESLTVVIPSKIFRGPVGTTELFAVICRAAGVFDVEALIAAEMESSDGFQYREQGASSGIVDLKQSFALHFAKDDTLLIGGQSLILNLSEARPEDGLLTPWLRQANGVPFVIVVNAEPIQTMFQQRPVPFPSPMQELLPFVMDARGLFITCDPDADPLATLTISFRQASLAIGLQTRLMKQLEAQRAALIMRKPSTDDDILTEWLSALISGVQLEVDGNTLRMNIARPKDLDALLQSLLKVAL